MNVRLKSSRPTKQAMTEDKLICLYANRHYQAHRSHPRNSIKNGRYPRQTVLIFWLSIYACCGLKTALQIISQTLRETWRYWNSGEMSDYISLAGVNKKLLVCQNPSVYGYYYHQSINSSILVKNPTRSAAECHLQFPGGFKRVLRQFSTI